MPPTDRKKPNGKVGHSVTALLDRRVAPAQEDNGLEIDPSVREIHETYIEDYRELVHYARRRVGSGEVAQDIVQEAFTNTLIAVEEGARIRNMAGFLQRCVCNLCENHARREPSESVDEELYRLTEQSTEASVDLKERWGEVTKAVDRLAPNQRYAFVLSELEGLESKEIARRLKVSTEAVWQLLCRARKNIRESAARRHSS